MYTTLQLRYLILDTHLQRKTKSKVLKMTSHACLPPTSTLPPVSHLATHTAEQVKQGLQNLRHLYFRLEPVHFHTSFLRRDHVHDTSASIPDSGYASAEEEEVEGFEDDESDTEAELLRADPFERSFAIKWLTSFITRSDIWITTCDSESDSEERSDILDQATAILSAFTTGDEETEVALTRTFSFPFTQKEIQVELNDAPLSKEDHTSVGLQSWGSSILLAERICLQPSFFSLTTTSINTDSKLLRILELGAGTGMLSIVVAKILQSCNPTPDIVATDYHPDVLHNLARNVSSNFPKSPITIKCLDWQVPHYSEPPDRPFDIILAADVIYHTEHAKWIKQCVEKLLAQDGVLWLIIPVRSAGRHEGLDRTVDTFFPTYILERSEFQLAILQKEEFMRQGSVGRADEGGYKLFKIGWINQ